MIKVKAVLMAVLLAGSMAVQAEARDQGGNGLMIGEGGGATPALVSVFGGRPGYYPPNVRCRNVVSRECWHGRCHEVVRTICRERGWREHRPWHGDRDWHRDWRDRDWRDRDWHDRDRWRDRERHDRRRG